MMMMIIAIFKKWLILSLDDAEYYDEYYRV